MSLTISELNAGIAYWRTTRWPQDFHNAFYQRMKATNPNGNFTAIWWSGFLPILSGWKALRPKSQAFVTNRASGHFAQLSKSWTSSIAPVLTSDIATIQWSQICSFPGIVAQIKNVTSPVFTSKFCHFLAPHIFPVIDNAAMGNPFSTYQAYYSFGRAEWAATSQPDQISLVGALTQEIGTPPIQTYPMKCKIIELCLIGRHQNGALIGSRGVASSQVPHHPAYGSVQGGSDQTRTSFA
jgi:hypothetical protein